MPTTNNKGDITSVLATAVPAIRPAEAEELARDLYGISATAGELTGERDRNFHLKAADGAHYVLKISNAAEDRLVTNFQTQALLHVEAVDPGLPVPRVLRTLDGEVEHLVERPGAEPRLVRVLTYLHGQPLHAVPRTPAQRRNLGDCLARLDLALRGFFHPAAGHELMWDIKHASQVRPLLVHIPEDDRRALAERTLDAFEQNALPVLPRLRAQVIHNDLNPHNVLVRPDAPDEVAGIIDFGDMVHAPLINDLAVAAAYQTAEGDHPLASIAEFVAAYHARLPLEPAEIDVLFDLIATRMLLTVAITGWRAARYPENRTYILRNNPQAWAGLARLTELSRPEAQAYLRRACGLE